MLRFFLLILFPCLLLADTPVNRKVLAFWDSQICTILEKSSVHKTLETPLNHLGIDIEYFDIQKPLPSLSQLEKFRGILLCLEEKTKIAHPSGFIDWCIQALEQGNKIVIVGNPGFLVDTQGVYTSIENQNRLYERIGFIKTDTLINYTYDYSIVSQQEGMFSFERDFPTPLPSFYVTHLLEGQGKSYLSVAPQKHLEERSDLVMITPRGAYVSDLYLNNFAIYVDTPQNVGWFINPFRFFTEVFDLEGLPIPDTTTLAGRRIFFTTCHGDNFITRTSIEEYEGKEIYCGDILYEKVFKPNPDIPMTMAIIAAEVDPDWVGKPKSQELARKYFQLPNVEAASHTYSHPFYWDFFEKDGSEKERKYLYLYPYGSWGNSYLSWMRSKLYQTSLSSTYGHGDLSYGYITPRAYANKPFDVAQEITGAVKYLNKFAPSQNKVHLLVWSGDSLPWDTPVELCQKAGIQQFGGGDVRFDADFPSLLFVSPLGRKPAGIVQLYEASDAENSYTDGWRGPFYGYKLLPATLQNTESPRRLKPIQLYFHSYSGQFQASVDALLSNIAYVRSLPYIAVTTSRYVDVGEGFYSAQFDPISENSWRIRNRKGLQTIRFENRPHWGVDLANSVGIIGYMHYQDSLYIYLDKGVEEPIFTLRENITNTLPYLLDSSWEIWDLDRRSDGISFKTKGWGKCVMQWKMKSGNYVLKTGSTQIPVTDIIELDLPFNQQIEIQITRK